MTENRIKDIREARGLSLAVLAKRVGTTNQQISHLELGKRRLTAAWLIRLADALACDPLELLGIAKGPLLTEQERFLLTFFRQFSPDQQRALLGLAGAFANRPVERD